MTSKMADSTGTDQAPVEVTKESIRKKVWDHIETENLANFPRPVTKRIPNFKGAEEAAVKAAELDVFKNAQTVKINPDKPQQHSRFLTIEAGKTLLVPTPRLRTGLFNKIIPPEELTKDVLRICSTSQGVREHSVPLGLDANIKIDLVIVGSVAVSSTGLRIGKGEGFADLEYAMMMTMGAIQPDTIVVSTVHDCQVMDVPESLMGEHDLNVDYIVTDTEVIKCQRSRQQPTGIIWNLLTEEKLDRVPILRKLRLAEFRKGKDVRLKDEEEAPSTEKLEEDDQKVDEMVAKEADEPPQQRYRRGRFYRRRYGGGQRQRRRQTDGDEADGEKGSASESDGTKKPQRPRRQRPRRKRNSARGPEQEENGPRAEGETEGSGDENKGGDRKRPYRRRWRRRAPGSGGGRRPSEGSGDDKENERDDRQPSGDGPAGSERKPRRGRRPRNARPGVPRSNPSSDSSLFVGNIPRDLRVSEFKTRVRAMQVQPMKVIWQGNNARAFLVFSAYDETQQALSTLQGMEILEQKLDFQLSNSTRAKYETPTDAPNDGAPVDAPAAQTEVVSGGTE